MADFTSNFWGIFIAVTTILSILACFVLVGLVKGKKKKKPAGEEKETTGHIWDEDLKELNNPLPGWWLNLFYITLVFGLVYVILYPGLGIFNGILDWSQTKQYEQEMKKASEKYDPIFEQYANTPIKELANNPEAIEVGESLYSAYCTTCHGSDARGARGYPNLRDDNWQWGGEPQQIKTSILKGRQAAMPAWEGVIKKEDLSDVTEYVISMSGRIHDSKSAANGKKIYNQYCAACHGAEGKGNVAMGATNLTDDIWLYGGSKKRIMESLLKGRQGVMPAHEEFLGEAKVHVLTAYIYSLSN